MHNSFYCWKYTASIYLPQIHHKRSRMWDVCLQNSSGTVQFFCGFGSRSISLIHFLHRELKKNFKLRTKSTNSEMNLKIANFDLKQKEYV